LEDRVYKIFVDFDGTITKRDVGEAMFLEFGNPDKAYEIIELWMEDKISSMETWERLCKTVKNFNEDNFLKFLDTIEVDDGFAEFVQFCRSNKIEIKILSDGLDYYIEKLLLRYGFNDIPVFSNQLKFGKNNELIPVFPYRDEECSSCANCKRNHVIDHSGDDEYSIYIGDGLSDKCPAQYCDFIFAKNSLLKYCEKNRITYFPYKNFNDIIKRLEELKNKKRLKKRHQAELKRKEVYSRG